MDKAELCRLADEARKNSYCIYSGFSVGAALLTANGSVYKGCNIENASYPAGICADPCGICRQFMNEFVDGDSFEVLVVHEDMSFSTHTLAELLPYSFGPKSLKK